MASQMSTAVVAAVTTSIVSLLGFVIQDWLGRRSRLERRRLLFEDASRRVAFATDWWKGMEQLSPSPDELTEARTRSLVWLHEASALIAEAKQLPIPERAHLSPRRVLLIYRFERRSAKVIRLCFFLVLAYAIQFAALIPADRGTSYFTSDLLVLAGFVVGALLLRAWAVTVEKRSPNPAGSPTAPGSGS
ncbi:hypothetical protein [Kitasatospora sp. LaBMicrA B282]|uniref:hypothetical protein n=1 Tax=Kitasatospora sp. LaBMicrA B282 TaxID=3420949 RepID=UPI003D137101